MKKTRTIATGLVAALIVGAAVLSGADPVPVPEGVPGGYKLQYAQDFKSAEAMKDFVYTDPDAWRHGAEKDGGRRFMELFKKSKYKYKVRSPFNIALVKNKKVGSFVLQAELEQTGREYGHRDLCLFWGFQDPSKFYYVHIASKSDPHAHQIFIVNDKPRTKITDRGTPGHKWSSKPWHTVRIVRDIESGRIAVYANDLTKPIMEARDKTFGAGYVGFGSFDDTGRFSKVRLWAAEAEDKAVGHFKTKQKSG